MGLGFVGSVFWAWCFEAGVKGKYIEIFRNLPSALRLIASVVSVKSQIPKP